jgi:hypothetical protein
MVQTQRFAELSRDEHLGSPGSQRILAPEPELHWCGPQFETGGGESLFAAGRELLPIYDFPLLAI